jgi:hypothetical protein
VLAVLVVVPIAIGLFFHESWGRPAVATLLAGALLPSMIAVLAVHELGHVASGLAAGYRFLALIVGPFAVSKTTRGWRVEANPSWSLMGGIAVLVPRHEGLPSRTAAAALLAGGPIASVLLSIVGFTLHYGLDLDEVRRSTVEAGTHTIGQLVLAATTLVVGGTSAAVAVATLVPQAVGGFTSDGAGLLLLARGGPPADRLRAMSSILGRATAGRRPREWSLKELRAAAEPKDATQLEFAGASLVFAAALDRGDLIGARNAFERMRAASLRAPSISLGELHDGEAFLAAIDGDPAAARAAYERTDGTFVDPASRARVLAAVLLAEGRTSEAVAEAIRGLRHLDEQPMAIAGYAAPEREWLAILAAGRMPLAACP